MSNHRVERNWMGWVAFAVVIAVVIAVIFLTAEGGNETSAPSSPTTTRTSVTPTVAVTTINPAYPTGELIVNSHPVPEPSATTETEASAFQFSTVTGNDPQELEDRLGQFIQDYYGFDSQDAQALGPLNCAPSTEPRYQEVANLNARLAPYLQLLQQVRDSRLDNLLASGIINDSEADGPPVLPVLKSQSVNGDWDGTCALFNGRGFITATPDTDSDGLRATPRDETGTRIYLNVPIKQMMTLRTTGAVLPIPGSSELRTEWHYRNGHWVMMSYAPER